MSREIIDEYPEELRIRMRNTQFLDETRSGRYRRGQFPPYVSGCRDSVAVGASAAVKAAIQTDSRRRSTATTTPQRHRSTIAELALGRYGTSHIVIADPPQCEDSYSNGPRCLSVRL